MSERVIKVSPHLLMDVAACSTKGWIRHVKGYTSRGEAIKAIAGQAFHKAMETLFDPQFEDADRSDVRRNAIGAFHAVYDAPHSRVPAEALDAAYTPQNLDRVLKQWIEVNLPKLPWRRVLMVEEAFVAAEWRIKGEVPCPTNGIDCESCALGIHYIAPVTVQLIVRPDLVVEDFNGMIRWVDTKTTGWHIDVPSWQQELRLSSQAELYTAGIQARFGDKAILGGWFSAIELRKLPGSGDDDAPVKLKKDGTPAKPRTCKDHGQPYTKCGHEHAKSLFVECKTTPERVDRALADAKESAVKFIALLDETNVDAIGTDGTQKGACRFCPATDWCEGSRPHGEGDPETLKDILDSFFVYSPWPIEEGKRAE